jgi:hypothetical protein
MTNHTFTRLVLSLGAALSILSCSKPTEFNNYTSSGHEYTYDVLKPNPYEWAGEVHNDALHYLMSTSDLRIPILSQCPSAEFNTDINNKIVEYFHQSGHQTSTTLAELDRITERISPVWHDHRLLFETAHRFLDSASNYSSGLSNLDIHWTRKIVDLAARAIEQEMPTSELLDSVAHIESSIMNQSWGECDFLARMGIAIYKHSLLIHAEHAPIHWKVAGGLDKTPVTQAHRAVRIAAGASADFLGGMVAGGLVTCAGAGWTVGAAVWAGVKAGAACSGAVDMLGGWAGFW